MNDIFKDILSIEGVCGVAVIDAQGGLILSRFSDQYRDEASRLNRVNWNLLARELADIVEAEFVFEKRRIYVRKIQPGFFITLIEDIAPVTMVRMNCEVLQSSLDSLKSGGRISQILKKRIF
ncbi:MAG: hypothetical protein K9J79_00245 [Desulfobacteraceae bacterium]|nr:hypothetical protein [Desulfobacteraceae bacterium]